MKKPLPIHTSIFILALAGIMHLNSTAQTPISNGGFENWEDVVILDFPDHWLTDRDHRADELTTQVEEATDGDYSLKLTTIDDPDSDYAPMGFAVLGEVGDEGPTGGIPWTEDVDELLFDVKYHAEGDDKPTVLVMVFDSNGSNIGGGTRQFTGTQDNDWDSDVSVPLAYTGTPAEIMIGFVSSDHMNEDNITPGSWIQVDNLRLLYEGTEATTPIPNFSFEDWSDLTINDPEDWISTNMELSEHGVSNVAQSTDAVEGSVAARLENLDIDGEVRTGTLTYGETLWDGYTSYTDKPDFLVGSYKYTPAENDTAKIYCGFDDDTDNENGILGNIYHEFGETNGYEEFILPASYWDEKDTEYINLGISSGGEDAVAGSVLWVDDLQFVNGYDVEFTVHDDETPEQNYLEDATIDIETYKPRPEDPLITDQNGFKQLKLPNGTYNFTVSAEGYDDYSGTITIDNEAATKEVTMSVATGIEEQQTSNLSVYPNPASEIVFIRYPEKIKRIKIVNMDGTVISEKRANGKQPFINLGDIPTGQYIIQIQTEKSTISQSIMVER
ncbi:MAG: T9SS type A sorting domain-containing protein [Bacteroidota bacterium]